jgi:hypothetical protein
MEALSEGLTKMGKYKALVDGKTYSKALGEEIVNQKWMSATVWKSFTPSYPNST